MPQTLKIGATGPEVTHLQTLLAGLAYPVRVDGDFGPRTEASVRLFQAAKNLAADGVVGPKTWAALAAATAPKVTTDPLARAGEIAVEEALRLWGLDITDPPNSARAYAAARAEIDRMIRSPEGLGWSWQKPYVQDGDYEWCGAFAGTCWAKAGLKLKPHRYTFFSSTYRLDLWGRYVGMDQVANPRPRDGAPRQMLELDARSKPEDVVFPDGTRPRPGDVFCVGSGSPVYGSHIGIVEKYDVATGVVSSIEGNAGSRRSGLGPTGTHREGVIRAKREVGIAGYHVRRFYRPSLVDLA